MFAQYPQLGDTTPFAYKWTTQDLSVSFVHSSYTLSNHYFGHMLLCKMMDPLFLSFPSDYFLSFTFSRAPPLLFVLPCIILISFLYFSPDAQAYTPPSVNSQQFLDETNEVYLVGGRTAASTLATDATKNTSDFWADGNGTVPFLCFTDCTPVHLASAADPTHAQAGW